MINVKSLPDGINALGHFWRIDTCYKLWIDYPERIQRVQEKDYEGYAELFVEDVPIPCVEVIEALNAFYYTPSEIPRNSGSGEELMSYEYDMDYIYAGFMQAYGIDIVDTPLHWHKFLALLVALPEDTMLSKIIGYRAYKGSKKTNPDHDEYVKRKQAWSLPTRWTKEELEAIEHFNSL